MEGNGSGGNWKSALTSVGAVIVVLLIFIVTKRRTVHNFLEVFRDNPVTAILILVIAVIVAVGITLLRNFIRNNRK